MALAFSEASVRGDGKRACELMTPEMQDRTVTSGNRWARDLAPGAPGLSECPEWMTLAAAMAYGQVGPNQTPSDAGRGRRERAADLAALRSSDGGSVSMDGDHAHVAGLPGLPTEVDLDLTRVEGRWLVSRATRVGSDEPEP